MKTTLSILICTIFASILLTLKPNKSEARNEMPLREAYCMHISDGAVDPTPLAIVGPHQSCPTYVPNNSEYTNHTKTTPTAHDCDIERHGHI